MELKVNFTPLPTKQVTDLDAVVSMLYAAEGKRLNLAIDRKQARVIEMAVRTRSEGLERASLAAIKVGSNEVGFEISVVPVSGRTRTPSEVLPSASALQALDKALKENA